MRLQNSWLRRPLQRRRRLLHSTSKGEFTTHSRVNLNNAASCFHRIHFHFLRRWPAMNEKELSMALSQQRDVFVRSSARSFVRSLVRSLAMTSSYQCFGSRERNAFSISLPTNVRTRTRSLPAMPDQLYFRDESCTCSTICVTSNKAMIDDWRERNIT